LEAVTVYAPGSASNLGSGFDCLGVAFTGMGDRVLARRSPSPGVRVASVSETRIPLAAERNTAAIAAGEVLKRARGASGLELEIEKGLPLAAGLGGSAASAVGGALAANVLLGTHLTPDELLAIAIIAESVVSGRHPDNAAPCLLGGAILVSRVDPPRTRALVVHPSLSLVLVTPHYEVETSRARAVLPTDVPRRTAVRQAAHLALLVLGLERGDGDLIRQGMEDSIAEPPRLFLYPGYPEARALALEAGAFGAAVSGGGPSLIAVVPEGASQSVGRALEDGYRKTGIQASAHPARVDLQGARTLP
jgi:homoserine kinase